LKDDASGAFANCAQRRKREKGVKSNESARNRKTAGEKGIYNISYGPYGDVVTDEKGKTSIKVKKGGLDNPT